MALTVLSRPDSYSAAYLPVEYKFTSDLSPNSISGESDSNGTLFGSDNSGEDILVGTQPLPLVVGDYVYLENAGVYNGVHRVSSINNGTEGVSVTGFFIDTPVTTETTLPGILKQAVEVSKYYNNYNAVVDVYISGSFVVRLRTRRNFDNEFIFDLSSIIQEYLGSDLLALGTSTTSTSVDLSKEVYIQYAEEYDVISNGIATLTLTSFTDDSSNPFTAVNSTIPYVFMNDFAISSVNYNLSDFYSTNALFNGASAYNWLTLQPEEVRISSNDSYQMSFINATETYNGGPNPIAVNLDYVLRTYDNQGSLIATNIVVIDTDTTTNLEGVYNVPVGPSNLSAYITSDVVKYTVQTRIDEFILADLRTFIIEDDCSPTRVERRFEWVNSLGGIDAFTFKGKEVRDIDVEKRTFKRILNSVRSIPERSVTTFGVETKDVYTVNSGIVSKKERDWLLSLVESPEVYLVVDGYRLPVQVNTTFGVEKLAEYSYNVTMEYELAYEKIIQRN
jgi:hypothetical protein